jgi:uncharacterized protein (TIRG00374 family)
VSVRSSASTVSPTTVVTESERRGGVSRGTIVKLVVTIGLMGYVLWRAGLQDALETLRSTEWRFVALAASSAVLAMVVNVKRWQIMLAGQGGQASLGNLTRLYLIGMFFNNILPSRFGGDVVRAYGASIRATTKTRSVAAVFMDRLVGALSVLVLGVLAIVAYPSIIPVQLGELLIVGLVFAALALGLLLYRGSRLGFVRGWMLRLADLPLLGPRVRPRIDAAIDAVRSYSRNQWLVGQALAVSMVANGLSILNLYLYSQAVGADISLPQMAVVAPVVLAVGMLPVSINGIGTIELTFVVLLGAMGVDSHVALAVAILRRVVLLALSLAGGLLYATRRFG